MAHPTHEVVDARTGLVVGKYVSSARALAAADRRDRAYGAVRYMVRPLPLAVAFASGAAAGVARIAGVAL